MGTVLLLIAILGVVFYVAGGGGNADKAGSFLGAHGCSRSSGA